MIFVLKKCLFENTNPNSKPKLVSALESLVDAYRLNKILLLVEVQAASFLSSFEEELSNFSYSTLKGLSQRWSTSSSILNTVDYYIEVVNTTSSKQSFKYSKQVLLEDLCRVLPNIVETVRVLGENLRDAHFYIMASEAFLFKKNIKGLKVNAFSIGTGGSTMAQMYENFTKQEQPCFAIIDSDRKAPEGTYKSKLGDTAKAIRRVQAYSVFTGFYIMKVHECENLLPKKLLKEVIAEYIDDQQNKSECLNFIERDNLPTDYFDFKSGASFCYLIEQDLLSNDYWKDNIKKFSINKKCLKQEFCLYQEDCSCLICPSFGENLLKNSVNFLNTKSPREKASLIEFDQPELEHISRRVFSYCIAVNRHFL